MTTEQRDVLAEILEDDPRFRRDAYFFVYEALQYTTKMLGLDRIPPDVPERDRRHVTGQQLLEGVRRLALKQFGYLAHTVFESWGIRQTVDWGQVVFNLIKAEQMHKRDEDKLEDFADRYSQADALEGAYFRDRLYHENRIDESVAVRGLTEADLEKYEAADTDDADLPDFQLPLPGFDIPGLPGDIGPPSSDEGGAESADDDEGDNDEGGNDEADSDDEEEDF